MLLLLASACAVVSERLHIVFGASGIPHPAKVKKGGEDAYFYDDSSGSFGVADGVGGSATSTVDPGKLSREVLQRCHCVIAADCGDDAAVPTLPQVLTTASEKPLSLGGSCTLLLGQLDVQTRCLRGARAGGRIAMPVSAILPPCR